MYYIYYRSKSYHVVNIKATIKHIPVIVKEKVRNQILINMRTSINLTIVRISGRIRDGMKPWSRIPSHSRKVWAYKSIKKKRIC